MCRDFILKVGFSGSTKKKIRLFRCIRGICAEENSNIQKYCHFVVVHKSEQLYYNHFPFSSVNTGM